MKTLDTFGDSCQNQCGEVKILANISNNLNVTFSM